MLIVKYKCNKCKTKFERRINEKNLYSRKWINNIGKDSGNGFEMDGKGFWFIDKKCPICGEEHFYKDQFSGWNYADGLESIKYSYTGNDKSLLIWFDYLNG